MLIMIRLRSIAHYIQNDLIGRRIDWQDLQACFGNVMIFSIILNPAVLQGFPCLPIKGCCSNQVVIKHPSGTRNLYVEYSCDGAARR